MGNSLMRSNIVTTCAEPAADCSERSIAVLVDPSRALPETAKNFMLVGISDSHRNVNVCFVGSPLFPGATTRFRYQLGANVPWLAYANTWALRSHGRTALHFHIIPISGWVKESFFSDPRYRVFQSFYQPSDGDDAVDETDGAELTLYVWREFCENPNPPPISGPPIREVVARLNVFLSPRV